MSVSLEHDVADFPSSDDEVLAEAMVGKFAPKLGNLHVAPVVPGVIVLFPVTKSVLSEWRVGQVSTMSGGVVEISSDDNATTSLSASSCVVKVDQKSLIKGGTVRSAL